MPWTGTVVLDDDKPDVGVAIAVWNKGLPDEFTYSRRTTIKGADRTAFLTEAKAALAKRDSQSTKADTLSTALTTALNA